VINIPTITLKYMAVLKGLSEEPLKSINIEGDTLKDLLDYLKNKESPKVRSRLFNEDGSLHSDIIIFINGKDYNLIGGLNTKIKDGDEIVILPTVHGG
jgi:molybdopterin synthase sulfur carrier subunit